MTDKIEKKTAEDFIKAYEDLCKKYGYSLNIVPTWVSTNHGSFEMILKATVAQLSTDEATK